MSKNKENFLATGGGPSTEIALNETEESVAEFLLLDRQVHPTGHAHGLGSASVPNTSANCGEVSCDDENADGNDNASDAGEPATRRIPKTRFKKSKKSVETERLQQLKKQARTQTEILKTLKNMDTTMYKSYKLRQKYYELKMEKTEAVIEHTKIKIVLAKRQLQKD